ncbi:NAD(P)-dependent oxidoreductase [Massilia niastensis]|uniref:NAD(P)-dependent oxidoreductase n=1 Tax=Massilia niastensis TaxID=544911 RepID=UPI00036A4718|nr:NAD(P)-dependent oxidoreductase [Massilia niastensis]
MKVVFLDAATLPTTLRFQNPAVEYSAYSSTAQAAVIDRIRDATVVITNKVRLGAEELRAARQLRLVAVAAAGTDNIDQDTAAQLGIRVANVPDYGSDSVAEHVIATLFALRRHIVTYASAALDGRWTASEHFCWNGPRIRDVGGSLFGVVGRGRIGEAAARLARGLGMEVFFAQTPGKPCRGDELPLDQLLARADVLTLHVPLTPDTRGMIGKESLARMKRDAVIINTGRGALVDAPALVSALHEGLIAGAAIDVLDVEPPPADHPLLAGGVPNLLVTPHVAWASENAQARLASKLEQLVEKEL